MTVALATIETDVYTTFYNFFTSGTYSLVTSGTISSTSQVTPTYSDNTSNQYGFPVVEISPLISDVRTDRMGNVQKAEVNVQILIVEDNASDAKATIDKVRSFLLLGKMTFRNFGLQDIKLIDVSNNLIHKNKKHYHYKRLTVSCSYMEKI